MAFLKEQLNAFLDQPVEKKRRDHKLKNVDSATDARSWVLNEELKRQQFLNVVNQTSDGGGEGEEGLEEEFYGPISKALLMAEGPLDLEETIRKLEDEKHFLKNVIADKENEIEQLIHRIEVMSEIKDSGISPNETAMLQKQLNDLKNQYNAKEEELKKTKDMLNTADKMLGNVQTLMDSTDEEPEKQKAQLDNIMRGLQASLQDEIENLQSEVNDLKDKLKDADDKNLSLSKQLEALASGDDNELNKIIFDLRKEADNIKASKDAENKALRDIIDEKDKELENLKNILQKSQPFEAKDLFKTSQLPQTSDFETLIAQRDNEISALKDKLENEKLKNKVLNDQLDQLAANDESGLKNRVLDLTAELESLRQKYKDDEKVLPEKGQEKLIQPTDDSALKELQALLNQEKDKNEQLKKDLESAREKFNKLASADDSELKKLLAGAENEIDELKKDLELKDKQIATLSKGLPSSEAPKSLPHKADLDGGLVQSPDTEGLQEIKKLKNENDDLKKLIERLKTQKPDDINELLEEIANLQAENRALKDKLLDDDKGKFKTESKQEIQLDNLNDVDALLERVKQLSNENENLKRKYELLEKELKDKENETVQSKTGSPDLIKAGVIDGDVDLLKKENSALKKEKDDLNRENELLKLRNGNLEDEIKKLSQGKPVVKDSELEKSKLDPVIQVTDTELSSDPNLDSLNKKLKQLEAENNNLKKLAKEDKDQCNEDLSEKDKTIDKLKDEINNLKQENNKLSNDINKLKSKVIPPSIDDSKEKPVHKEKEPTVPKETEAAILKDKKDEELSKLLNENKSLNNENDKLMKENDKLKKDLENAKVAAKGKQPIDEKDSTEKDLLAENKKLKGKIESLENELKDALSKTADKEVKEKDKKPETDAVAKDHKEENDKLKEKVISLENQVKDLKSKLAGGKAVAEEKDMKPDSFKDNSDKLVAENEQLKEKNKSLESQVNDLKLKLADKQGDKKELKDETFKKPDADTGNEELNKLHEENIKLKNKVNPLEAEIKSLKERLKPLEDEVKDLRLKVADKTGKTETKVEEKDLKPDVDDVNYKKIEAENTKLKEKIKALENELQNLKSKTADDKEKPYVKESATISEDKSNSELIQENKKLQEKIKSLENEIKALKGSIDKKDKPALGPEDTKEFEKLRDEKDKISKENDILNVKMRDLNKLLNEEKAQNKNLKEENKQLSDVISKAAESGGLKEDEILKMYKENNEKLKKENANQKIRIDEVEKELDNLKDLLKKGGVNLQDKSAEKGKLEPKDVAKDAKSTQPKQKVPQGEKEKLPEVKQQSLTTKDEVKKGKDQKDFVEKVEKLQEYPDQLQQKDKKTKDKAAPSEVPKDKTDKLKDKKPLVSVKETPEDKTQPEEEKDQVAKSREPSRPGLEKMKEERLKGKPKLEPDEKGKDETGKTKKEPELVKEGKKDKLKDKTDVEKEKKGRVSEEVSPFDQDKKIKILDRPKPDDKETISKTKSTPQDFSKPKQEESQIKKPSSPKTTKADKEKVTFEELKGEKKDMKTKPDKKEREEKSGEMQSYGVKVKEDSLKKPDKVDKKSTPEKERTKQLKKELYDVDRKSTPEKDKTKQLKKEYDVDRASTPEKEKTKQSKKELDDVDRKATPEKDKTKQLKKDISKQKTPTKEKEIDEDERTDFEEDLEREKKAKKEPVIKIPKKKRERDYEASIDKDTEENKKIVLASEGDVFPKFSEPDFETKGFGDKDYDNLLNELKKKLNEAEKLIDLLNIENSKLKSEIQDLKKETTFKDDKKEKLPDVKKYMDESTNKLNRILQKAIRSGLKSLYQNELVFVHDSLNNAMAEHKDKPTTPGTGYRSPEEQENIIRDMNMKMTSLMQRLDKYRQHSSDQENKIMEYSLKVRNLSTALGIQNMKIESQQLESTHLRGLVKYEKEKSKKLEELLRSVLDSCKCTNKWVLQHNYTSLF